MIVNILFSLAHDKFINLKHPRRLKQNSVSICIG